MISKIKIALYSRKNQMYRKIKRNVHFFYLFPGERTTAFEHPLIGA